MSDMKKICCVGDSNTYGFDPREPLGFRYPEEIRWTCRIQNPERDICNMGMNGLTVPVAPSFYNIPEWIRRNGPMDEIVVMLGTNDLLEEDTAEETAARMKSFLLKLMENCEPQSILLLAPPVFRAGEWVEGEEMIEESRRLGPLYKAVAEELQVRFADTAGWEIEVLYDGVHFSPDGHKAFAEQLDRLL